MNLKRSFFSCITAVLAAFPLGAASPKLHVPFDETAEVLLENGRKAEGVVYGRINYPDGVSGKGLMVKRDAYDQVTAACFRNLPVMNLKQGTLSFHFKPEWEVTDNTMHYMFYLQAGQFRIYMVKTKTNRLDVSICSPKQIQLLSKPRMEKGRWHHLAATWDLTSGKGTFYLDGALIAERAVSPDQLRIPDPWKAPTFWLGLPGSDRFKAKTGDGVYDDLKLFDRALTLPEIQSLALNAQKKAVMKATDLSGAFRSLRTAVRFDGIGQGQVQSLLELETPQGGGKIYYSETSRRLTLEWKQGETASFVHSPYPLSQKQEYLISFHREDGTLAFYLDGAEQGRIPIPGNSPLNLTVFRHAENVRLSNSIVSVKPLAAEEPDLYRNRFEAGKTTVAEAPLWKLDDAAERKNAVRRAVSLNGLWRTYPTNDYAPLPPSAGTFGYMRVPGSFRSPLFEIYRAEKGKLVPQKWTWNGKPLIQYRSGWYQRSFRVPESMKQGRLFLHFEEMTADYARIYVNGRLVDSFIQKSNYYTAFPNRRRIDISAFCRPENTVTIFLERRYAKLWQGRPSLGDHGCMALGNVWLESSESPVQLRSALAFPSVKKKQIAFRIRMDNPEHRSGAAELQVRFIRNGSVKKEFRHSIRLTGSPLESAVFSGGWSNPELWDDEHPNLYSMEVSLSGRDGRDALWALPFGFRELEVRPDAFYLNGKKFRFRLWSSPAFERLRFVYGTPDGAAGYVRNIKSLNFNAVRCSPVTGLDPMTLTGNYYRECDRQGVCNLVSMPPYDGGDKAQYEADLDAFVCGWANHPSILMWYTDFNTCGYPWNQDPAKLNDTAYVPKNKLQDRAKALYAGSVMERLDPSRPTFQHAGGNSGRIFTSMNYQSFGTPLQEQMDWPAQWAKSHTQPLISVESAFPFPAQFRHFGQARGPYLYAENAARYFGDSVYGDEARPAYSFGFCDLHAYTNWNCNYLRLKELFYRQVVRSWRAYDVSGIGDFPGGHDLYEQFATYNKARVGGDFTENIKRPGLFPDRLSGSSEVQTHMQADYTKPSECARYTADAFTPLMFFLGGDPERFTEQTHAWYSGEKFTKSIVAVNDHREMRKVTADWSLAADGSVVLRGSVPLELQPGEIRKVPLALQAPVVYTRTPGVLKLRVHDGTELLYTEEFALQFFPKRSVPPFGPCRAVLYDPEGRTADLLRRAGFPFRIAKSAEDVRSATLLIVGRNALKNGAPELLKSVDREQLVERGLNILIFEQQPCNMANLVMESPSYRNAFVRTPSSPLLAGLAEEDFSNWRGGTDNISEFVLSDEGSPHYPRSKWKCGNSGIVAAHVIRKPQYGRFVPVLDCGFNLMFSPLLVLKKERGEVLFCQMEVTPRYGTDPVATRLTDNMLSVMSRPQRAVPAQSVAYFGDDAGFELLKQAGMTPLRVRRSGGRDLFWNVQAVILGKVEIPDPDKADFRAALEKVLLRGGAVVATVETPLDLLPGRLSEQKRRVFKTSLPKTADPAFASIANADLFFRDEFTANVLEPDPAWLIRTDPAVIAKLDVSMGTLIIFRLPLKLKGFWNTEKVQRVFFTILSNLNLAQGKDLRLFSAEKFRHNTRSASAGHLPLNDWKLVLDPENRGAALKWQENPEKMPGGTIPVKAGLSWERQGVHTKNPHYQYPADMKRSLVLPYDGYAWLRTDVPIPASWKNLDLEFVSGPIDDNDWTYWNGRLIGATTFAADPAAYKASRRYRIPAGAVRYGKTNTLIIRVFDRWGEGGLLGPVSITARRKNTPDAWSPYYPELDFYDVEAFHNW